MNGDEGTGLKAKSVKLRAAAVQDVAASGSPDDVLTLLMMAKTDKSRSIKVCAAAAAADVLARHRGCAGQPPMRSECVDPILHALNKGDSASLPQLLLCYAAFPQTPVIKRLTRMLRDPRQTIRQGSAAALTRMALSSAAMNEGTGLREWIADALGHRKLPMDSALELIRLVGQVGWEVLRSPLMAASSRPGAIGEEAILALSRLDSRMDSESWCGIWIDEGRDVMELAEPQQRPWTTLTQVELHGNMARIDGCFARRIWAARRGEAGIHQALQKQGRTFWKLTSEHAIAWALEQDQSLTEHDGIGPVLLPMIDAVGGASGLRAAAILLVRTGQFSDVLHRLSGPLGGKGPRNDLFFLRGLAHHGLGDEAAARVDLERYLSKAKSKEPWREEAEQLLQ